MSNLTPIAPQLAAAGPTTLVFKETKGLTIAGKIKDTNGKLVFEIDAPISISKRLTIKDASGAKIGQLRKKKMPGLHPACYIGTMDDERKCMVKRPGMMNPTKCYADIYVGGVVIGEVTVNWRAKTFKISFGGNQVAEVKRKTGVTKHMPKTVFDMFDADSYFIDVVAGVDTAFISMIVIALDGCYLHEWI